MTRSSGFVGADPERLDGLAAAFRQEANDLREVASSSTLALMVAQWTGNRVQQLRDRWRQESKPALTVAANELERLAGELERHAREQREVSGSIGGRKATHAPYPSPSNLRIIERSPWHENEQPCSVESHLGGVGTSWAR